VPQFSADPVERAGEEKCVEDVATHGSHVLRVFGDDDWPEFHYTVGLFHNFRHPEVILLGAPAPGATHILNHVRDLVRAGQTFAPNRRYSDVLAGVDVEFRPVSASQQRAHFGLADWFYDREEYPVLQLIVPTKSGLWPWDSEIAQDL
jgi:hypothetical protein